MNISEIMNETRFSISGTPVTFLSIIVFAIIILIAFVASWLVGRGLKRALANRFHKREGTLDALLRLLHYIILIVGYGIALQTVGIDLSALFAAGAVFAIAIGFAMQNIIQNFVSGVILLLERSIKPGDTLEVEGKLVKVIAMGIRTTVVRSRLQEDLIMPNSIIAQSTVKNYTLRDNQFRLEVLVGVSYDSDMELVLKVLRETALNVPWKVDEKVNVLMKDFGASSVDFGVYITIDEPWERSIYASKLRQDIWFAFKREGIIIAYPQLDVHLDNSIKEAFSKLADKE